MKRKMLSTIVLVCLAAAVQARLGDSFKQSITRFGKPLGHFKDKYAEAALFEYKNYAVFVRYRYDKSFEETYAYLAPGVKDKLHKVEEWIDCFEIINNPKNLEPLNEKQRGMLRSANLKASWKMGKIKGNGIEEMFAVLGKRKVTGDYNIAKKFLVITETNTPELKVSPEEIAQAKAVCLPLGTKYEEYVLKYGFPYEVWSPKKAFFITNNYIIHTFYNNKEIENAINSGKLNESIAYLVKGMVGGRSKMLDLMVLKDQAVVKYSHALSLLKEKNYKYRKVVNVNEEEISDFIIQYGKIVDVYSESNLQSMSNAIIHAVLITTSNSAWNVLTRNSINKIKYATWKDGRRIYATYDIMEKYLRIEYGIAYDDFKPEVIKKLKEKKATEALEGF